MGLNEEILEYLKRALAMSKIGLSYSENPYDLERYEELKNSTIGLMAKITDLSLEDLSLRFDNYDDYPTPKVDVRALVMKGEEILLVQERADKLWALPGGWCDIGYSPKQNIVKEVFEETGLEVEVIRLLTVWDKTKHNHPPDLDYIYKLHFLCQITGGRLEPGHEVLDTRYFAPDKLPELSLPRNTPEQVKRLIHLSTILQVDVD